MTRQRKGNEWLTTVRRKTLTALRVVSSYGLEEAWELAKLNVTRAGTALQTVPPPAIVPGSAITGPFAGRMHVLYVIGTREGQSHRYRVDNVVEYLAKRNHHGDVVETYAVTSVRDKIWLYDLVVLFRIAMSDEMRSFICLAQEAKVPVVFDVDDWVFDEAALDDIDAIRDWPAERRERYRADLLGYRETLLASDFVTLSTERLASLARQVTTKPCFVMPNGLNATQVERINALKDTTRAVRTRVVLGYFSGTDTHRRDFVECTEALVKLMHEFDEVDLLIVGPLNLDSRFDEFGARIIRRPLVDADTLIGLMAGVDINLAPLEMDNQFCDAKSDLKYFESGAVGVPTVASRTAGFRASIIDGVNGVLAGSQTEWLAALRRLVLDKEWRIRVGESARMHVMSTYSPEALTEVAHGIYRTAIAAYREEKGLRPDGLQISWVIPEPTPGSGGHRNIFRVARGLVRKGHSVTLHVIGATGSTAGQLQKNISDWFFDVECCVASGVVDMEPCDVMFATHWTTAYEVRSHQTLARHRMYFIQDYEPMFAPMGTDYILAENTYRFSFGPVVSGPWCSRILAQQFGITAPYFRFPIDRSVYYAESRTPSQATRILFFARPEMPRRCYPIGVEALRIVKAQRPEVEIVFFGSDDISEESVGFEFKNIGTVRELVRLGELYRAADIGLAFSTTNPSLVPYEMMACGCPVVDLDYNENYVNYGGYEAALLVPPDAESVAAGVVRLVDDATERDARRTRGLEYAMQFPSEGEMVNTVENIVLEYVRNGDAERE